MHIVHVQWEVVLLFVLTVICFVVVVVLMFFLGVEFQFLVFLRLFSLFHLSVHTFLLSEHIVVHCPLYNREMLW